MKFLKILLPNLTIAMAVGLVVLLYLDNRNPMMGFLYGKPFFLYGLIFAICSVSVSVMFYVSWYKEKRFKDRSKHGGFEKSRKDRPLSDADSQQTQP